MIFLAIAWFGLLVFLVLWIILHSTNDKPLKSYIKNFQLLILILMTLYALVGIATKDPLSEIICTTLGLCIPAVVEWVAYIGVLGLLIWKFILVDMKADINLLKYNIYEIEKETSYIKATLEGVKNNTNLILNKARINL